jgi:hypothetical protein
VHDRLIDSKPKGNTQFDSLDDGCGQFAISDLPSRLPDARQISSFGRGDCENFSSTFAEHLHSEVVHGERRPQPYKERYQWQATSKPSMQMRWPTHWCWFRGLLGNWHFWTSSFRLCSTHLVDAHVCMVAFDKLETSNALYESNLNFALANRINAELRLRNLNIPESEVRLLQEYLTQNLGAARWANCQSVGE